VSWEPGGADHELSKRAEEITMWVNNDDRRDVAIRIGVRPHVCRYPQLEPTGLTRRTLTGIAAAAASLIAAHSWPAFAQAAVELVAVDVKAVAKGYRTSKLRSSIVTNDKDERIGWIDDMIIGIDKKTIFAVLQVGVYLGVGTRLLAVPFEHLVLDEVGTKITLPGASKDEISKLPEFKYI
jgi:hypothetical protein